MEQISFLPLTDFYNEILNLTEYVIKLEIENSSEADSRIENLKELGNALTHFQKEKEKKGQDATIGQFLEETALIADIDDTDFSSLQVNLMTLHVSKGLEFDHVFIVGLEEGLLPSVKQNQYEEDLDELEEERRLMYVGMTRARKSLSLSYCHLRKVWGKNQPTRPSRFIKEIPGIYYSMHKSSLSFSERSRSLGSWKQNINSQNTRLQNTRLQNIRSQNINSQNIRSQNINSFYKASEASFDPFPDYENNDGFFPDENDMENQEACFKEGTSVRHPVFGIGSVAEVEGVGEFVKVKVIFENQHIKKFMVKYAKLEII